MAMTMSEIARIELVPFAIPYVRSVNFATGNLKAAEHVFVRVYDDDGNCGMAEAIARPTIYGETRDGIMAAIAQHLAPCLLGRNLWHGSSIGACLNRLIANPTAKAALDVALWDLRGRSLGVSLHSLLGAHRDDVAVSGLLPFGAAEAVANQAVAMCEELGLRAFKVKVGRDPKLDYGLVSAVRDAVGESTLLYCDANHGFTSTEAVWFAEHVAELDVAWIEEPSPVDDFLARRRICQVAAMPIVGDESCPDAASAVREVMDGRSTMLSLKTARTGCSETDRIRVFCELTGTPITMGSQGMSGVGACASIAYSAAHESTSRFPGEFAFTYYLEEDLLAKPLEIRGGMVSVPNGAGWGFEVDEEKLAKYATERPVALTAPTHR